MWRTPNCSRMAPATCMHGRSESLPMMIPTTGAAAAADMVAKAERDAEMHERFEKENPGFHYGGRSDANAGLRG